MGMIEVHQKAIESTTSVYHEFLGRYKASKKCVYGFVEGKEDPSFYRGFIEYILPQQWQVDLWPAGNKDKVVQLHDEFDWSRFSKKQIVFFIDKDLSPFIGEKIPIDLNIYVTDGYSIENSIVNRLTFNRLLCEVFNFSFIPKDELDKILDIFEAQLNIFTESLIPIIAWIVHWKRMGEKPCLDDIIMKHIFAFSYRRLELNNNPKGKHDFIEYIHSQCNIRYENAIDTSTIEQELKSYGTPVQIVRGKYLLWFLVEFALYVYKNISEFIPSIRQAPKINITISQSNGVIFVAPRTRIPESLREFLDLTYNYFISEFEKSSELKKL